jgi:hypothetical protein
MNDTSNDVTINATPSYKDIIKNKGETKVPVIDSVMDVTDNSVTIMPEYMLSGQPNHHYYMYTCAFPKDIIPVIL